MDQVRGMPRILAPLARLRAAGLNGDWAPVIETWQDHRTRRPQDIDRLLSGFFQAPPEHVGEAPTVC